MVILPQHLPFVTFSNLLSSEKTTTPETTTIQATSEETRVTDTITSEVTTIITDSFEDFYGKTTGTLNFI